MQVPLRPCATCVPQFRIASKKTETHPVALNVDENLDV
jgi:hypothetical protein